MMKRVPPRPLLDSVPSESLQMAPRVETFNRTTVRREVEPVVRSGAEAPLWGYRYPLLRPSGEPPGGVGEELYRKFDAGLRQKGNSIGQSTTASLPELDVVVGIG